MKEGFTIIKSLKLPSNNDAIGLVENLIDEICAELAVNEDAYGNVLIAVTEGINNAIQHGNKYSKDLLYHSLSLIVQPNSVFLLQIRALVLIMMLCPTQRRQKIL